MYIWRTPPRGMRGQCYAKPQDLVAAPKAIVRLLISPEDSGNLRMETYCG
jgi:hypothetical protein